MRVNRVYGHSTDQRIRERERWETRVHALPTPATTSGLIDTCGISHCVGDIGVYRVHHHVTDVRACGNAVVDADPTESVIDGLVHDTITIVEDGVQGVGTAISDVGYTSRCRDRKSTRL